MTQPRIEPHSLRALANTLTIMPIYIALKANVCKKNEFRKWLKRKKSLLKKGYRNTIKTEV